MKLPKIFHSKARKMKDAFYAALAAQDAAQIGELLDAELEMWRGPYQAIQDQGSPEVLKMYIQKKLTGLNAPTSFSSGGQDMATHFLENRQYDRLEILFETGIDFNNGSYTWHPIGKVFSCDADQQQKLRWLEKMTAKGIDKIENKGQFLSSAIYYNLPEAVDMAVRLAIQPYANDEKYLRLAAEWQRKEMCLYLIEKHGADIERAKFVARSDPNDLKAYVFLSELCPAVQKKPATLESLSEEITTLRQAVAELTQLVKQQQNPVFRLDKHAPNDKLTP